jgi:hypothetical protein
LLVLLYVIVIKYNTESFNNINENDSINENYICFLCVNLTDELIETSRNMLKYGYQVFIMVDNNSKKHPKVIKDINILQMDDNQCIKLGYKNASATLKKNPVTWDKVFYYFSNIDTKFKNIWFIEEDVFIPRFDLLIDLDEKYVDEDLLCKQDIAHATDKLKWHWNRAKGKIDKPWHRSLLCCHRQSRRLLQRIKDYVDKNGSLLFLELMVNTLAHNNNYNVKAIPNLKTITWKTKYKVEDIKMDNFYHPMKDLKQQEDYRTKLNNK